MQSGGARQAVIVLGAVALIVIGACSVVAIVHPLLFVAADAANLRQGPGLDQPVIRRLEWGASVGLLELQGAWARVQPAHGKQGWILYELLSDGRLTREGAGIWMEHWYTYTRDANLRVVTLRPPIQRLDSAGALAIRGITDVLFGEAGPDDRWPEPVADTNSSLYRVPRASRGYWVVPVRNDAGEVNGLIIWPQFVEAAG